MKPPTSSSKHTDEYRPREECSFQEFPIYQSLDVSRPIPVLFTSSSTTKFTSIPTGAAADLSKRIQTFKSHLPKAIFSQLFPRLLTTEEPQGPRIHFSPPTKTNVEFSSLSLSLSSNSPPEYDMDEEDFAWLSLLNEERSNDASDAFELSPISPLAFERVMDAMENEWFHLTKHLQRQIHQEELSFFLEKPHGLPDDEDDLKCDVCGEADTSNSNVIVICDGCDLPVHQECYGVPFVPEGSWLCRKCMLVPEPASISCILCSNWQGQRGSENSSFRRAFAFKQTVDSRWVHSLCAFWVDETFPLNEAYQEPIGGIENIPAARWKLICSVCGVRQGAPIQCSQRACKVAFHASCAKIAGFVLDCASRACLCEKHSREYRKSKAKENSVTQPLVEVDDHDGPVEIFAEDCQQEIDQCKQESGKSAQEIDQHKQEIDQHELSTHPMTQQSTQNPIATLPPKKKRIPQIINNLIFQRILQTLQLQHPEIQQPEKFALSMARYWSLKRENRRGVPLLKRLSLEFNNFLWAERYEQQERLAKERYFAAKRLKSDLCKTLRLCELALQREKNKLKHLIAQKEIWMISTRPLNFYLSQFLFALRSLDPEEIFAHPVTDEIAPDYRVFVKEPMDFGTMQDKIHTLKYENLEEFHRDVLLVMDNCLAYNKPKTKYARAALRIKEALPGIYGEFDREISKMIKGKRTEEKDNFSFSFLVKCPFGPYEELEERIVEKKKKKEKIIKSSKNATKASKIVISSESSNTTTTELQESEKKQTSSCASLKRSKRNEGNSKGVEQEQQTLVWAKSPGFNWFPGLAIPKGHRMLRQIADDQVKKRIEKLKETEQIVRFFDNTWAFPEEQKISPLTNDLEGDLKRLKMVAGKLSKKAKEAYQLALEWGKTNGVFE